MERTEINVCYIKEEMSGVEKMEEPVHRIQIKRDKIEETGHRKGLDCYHSEENHLRHKCSFKNSKYYACGKIGYVSQNCLKMRKRDNIKNISKYESSITGR